MSKSNGNVEAELIFALDKITARDIRDLNKALRDVDTETAAKIYARVVTGCPASWGAPDDPETYMGLPFFTEFQAIITAMGEAAKNAKAG